MFKPELIPNSKTGNEFVLEENIKNPEDYFCSLKHDGGRVEINMNGPGLSRELKVLSSGHIQAMVKQIQNEGVMSCNEVLECEFYAPNMTFSEIMHFFKSSDVTSDKKKKYWAKEWEKTSQGTGTYTKTKNGQPYEQGWEFVGRTPEWLCTWHDELKLYAFNLVDKLKLSEPKFERNENLKDLLFMYNNKSLEIHLMYIDQNTFTTHQQIQAFYDWAVENNEEGIVAIRKDAAYKCGRHTMNSGNVFKLKEDKLEFDGTIIAVEEATEAREGSEKTINELGRSKTSQLKEDRVPSGIAKGFLVMMEDGREFTVSLNGYNEVEKRELLVNKDKYLGEWIRFTGMAPVKHGGMPRQARFTKGNFREAKSFTS
jgi:hypothetical protein